MLSIIRLLDRILWLYEAIIIVRCILSWAQALPNNPIIRFIYQITEPLMDAVRRAFPFLAMGGFDLSPIVIILLIDFTRRYLYSLLIPFY
ncbi:MAG: YggT family protein [Candidatus Omnitrophota bacterium]